MMFELATAGVWVAPILMIVAALVLSRASASRLPLKQAWQALILSSGLALSVLLVVLALFAASVWLPGVNGAMLAQQKPSQEWASGYLMLTPLGLVLAVLVQFLGTVILGFSSRYLAGEARQTQYMAAMAAVLAIVQLLLLANHWVLVIVLWSAVGFALQHLLCFYQERPFAQLAAHKKRIADYLADALLIAAAVVAWREVGSGSLSVLFETIARDGMNLHLQWSAVLLVLAVVLRTAALPFHGWLIQVMEAPTPVSALLHAGVVNLGGFALIRFASLLEHAHWARAVLLVFGLATAILAGMVMLTRVSIKLRLAWSTVAQMGFMLVECAAGLYSIAALHLLGHSLYKAHAFLASSNIVYETRIAQMRGQHAVRVASLVLAPCLSLSLVFGLHFVAEWNGLQTWVWWWNALFAFALAPLLWSTVAQSSLTQRVVHTVRGSLMVVGLAATALALHYLPFGLIDRPAPVLGVIALIGMAVLYVILALIEAYPQALETWRRWSYAGFYIDEWTTRLTLRIWPTNWVKHRNTRFEPLLLKSRANHQV